MPLLSAKIEKNIIVEIQKITQEETRALANLSKASNKKQIVGSIHPLMQHTRRVISARLRAKYAQEIFANWLINQNLQKSVAAAKDQIEKTLLHHFYPINDPSIWIRATALTQRETAIEFLQDEIYTWHALLKG